MQELVIVGHFDQWRELQWREVVEAFWSVD